jgi:tripartite-type tricarboxylate transporter receptor subunit TctC
MSPLTEGKEVWMLSRRDFVSSASVFSAAVLLSPRVLAVTWPSRTIKIIVPFGPGGSADVVARYISKTLEEKLGQTIVVEDRTGAAGTIGTADVAKSEPDGYTLLTISNTITANETLRPNRQYKLMTDLQPVALFNVAYNTLVVPPSSPFKNVSDLISTAKKKPGALNYATSGVGSVYHIIGETFRSAADIQVQHIPFRSSDQARTAVLGGSVDYMFDAIPTMLESIRGKSVRALATTGPERDPLLPDIPAVSETIPGFVGTIWLGLLAPAGTPEAIIERLNKEINLIVNSKDSLEWQSKLGFHPTTKTVAEFGQFLSQDIEQQRKWITAANITAE